MSNNIKQIEDLDIQTPKSWEQIQDNNSESKVISENLELLKWFYAKEATILDPTQKDKVFQLLTLASLEDPMCFMRILLFITNVRRSDKDEINYKTIVHFMCVVYPEWMLANLELFLKLGKKDDILYFVQSPTISARAVTYLKHLAKKDKDFQGLLAGKLINKDIKRKIFYKPKRQKKDFSWSDFLIKILDEPALNGITL